MIVAALGPKMLELAGTRRRRHRNVDDRAGDARDAHRPDDHRRGREQAGRPAPRIVFEPAGLRHVRSSTPARERAATDFQMYGFLPSYRAMLDREGAAGPADVAIVGDEATVTKGLGRDRRRGRDRVRRRGLRQPRRTREQRVTLLKSLL